MFCAKASGVLTATKRIGAAAREAPVHNRDCDPKAALVPLVHTLFRSL